MIRVEEVSKVFGPDPHLALAALKDGRTKSQIQADTGHVVGIDRASFELAPGEVFCIMGLSGRGKSTLIRCVNRIIEPTTGRIHFRDPEKGEQDVTAMSPEALRHLRTFRVSMVFQHFALFPHRTVLANAVYGLEIQGRGREERERIGRQVLEMVGLGDWTRAYPAELSGGMQQRVGLARALATQASVLLMDEPFSALDPLIKVNMQQELLRIQQELERTILFITHDLDEAMRIGDRIAIMEDGRIVQIGTPEEILVNPRTDYVANFVEHADPTGVITAGTIAVPFVDGDFELVREADGMRTFIRAGDPGLEYGVDSDNQLRHVRTPEGELPIAELDTVSETSSPGGRRRDDVIPRCHREVILRTVLRVRAHATRPVVVEDEYGRFHGVIDEPALIDAILEKRGYQRPQAGLAGAAATATH